MNTLYVLFAVLLAIATVQSHPYGYGYGRRLGGLYGGYGLSTLGHRGMYNRYDYGLGMNSGYGLAGGYMGSGIGGLYGGYGYGGLYGDYPYHGGMYGRYGMGGLYGLAGRYSGYGMAGAYGYGYPQYGYKHSYGYGKHMGIGKKGYY